MSKSDKRQSIINAAQKRFLHFGVDKTTMNEIADDLSLSKASLYYYFPDKLNLFAAVLQSIIDEEESRNQEALKEKDPLKAISTYLENRTQFIISYYNILEYLRTLNRNVPEELEPVFNSARKREIKVLTGILDQANRLKILKVGNSKVVSELFLDCLEGLRLSIFLNKINFFPDKKEFQSLLKREKEFASIFLQGLSC